MTAVHAHEGGALRPVDVDALPAAVREIVAEHVEWTDAYELEVRHYGNGTVDLIHRFTPDP